MALTSIGQFKTPGRPIEITFGANLGTPSDSQELTLIGHVDPSFAASGFNKTLTISNSADVIAASGECVAKGLGAASEITKMVLAAINANAGGSTFPKIKVIPIADGQLDFGTNDEALLELARFKSEFPVSCFDGMDNVLGLKFLNACKTMSGATRVHNNQYGSVGVLANKSVVDPSLLYKYDSQFVSCVWHRSATNAYSVGEIAAAYAALNAANGVPYNGLDNGIVNYVPANEDSEKISVGAGLESEVALQLGWTPLKTNPNGTVAIVRAITSRLSVSGDGASAVTSYFDLQDFQALYFWRKTLFTRFSQPDFVNVKASNEVASRMLGEMIRLARVFEQNEIFQAVDQLAKLFVVERNASDRGRFDFKTPVNVVPNLHIIAGNIEASTLYDTVTI